MENKILEFVREFNAVLENSNEYNSLQYQNDGYQEGILIPNIYLWSDDEGTKYFKQKALSSLTKQLFESQRVASDLLVKEVSKFFAEKKKQLKEISPEAILTYKREAVLKYEVEVEGDYSRKVVDEFLEILEADFLYIFQGLKVGFLY